MNLWDNWTEKQQQFLRPALALLVLMLLPALLLTALRSRTPFSLDPGATNAPRITQANEADMLAALQTQAEEERFRLKLNGAPTFNADGEGDLLLQNPLENAKSIQVKITLDETGEEVYKSAVLPPGAQELRVALATVPPPGTHAATAEVSLLESGTDNHVGSMAAQLTLTIMDTKYPEN